MKHLEVVAGILIYNGKILCMQRNKGKYAYLDYTYEFPGGKIEDGESKEDALMRELREELNLSISNSTYYHQVSYSYPDFSITLYCFICRLSSPEFTRKEHANHQWLKYDELESLNWAPADIEVVKKLEEEKIQ